MCFEVEKNNLTRFPKGDLNCPNWTCRGQDFFKKYPHPEVLQEDHHITFYFLKNTEAFVDNETPDNQQEGDVLNDKLFRWAFPRLSIYIPISLLFHKHTHAPFYVILHTFQKSSDSESSCSVLKQTRFNFIQDSTRFIQ